MHDIFEPFAAPRRPSRYWAVLQRGWSLIRQRRTSTAQTNRLQPRSLFYFKEIIMEADLGRGIDPSTQSVREWKASSGPDPEDDLKPTEARGVTESMPGYTGPLEPTQRAALHSVICAFVEEPEVFRVDEIDTMRHVVEDISNLGISTVDRS